MPTNDNLFAEDEVFTVDPSKNYLEELVGEGKKFSTPEELARGKAEADAYIARIEDEQARLRQELATRISLEKFQDQLNALSQNSNRDEPNREEPSSDVSAMKPEEVERLLEEKLNRREQERTATQNLNLVRSKLGEVLGPNYAQHLRRQAQELSMSEQEVQRLAASNPKALFKLLGIDDQKRKTEDNIFHAPRSQTAFTPTVPGKKGDSYYEAIRKNKPEEYWSPKIQNEIFERMKEMGHEDYYNS